MNKLFYPIFGIALIIIGVSAFLWFSQPAHITEPNRQTDEKVRHSNNANLPQPRTVLLETSETGEAKIMDKFRAFLSEEQLAAPEAQRILKILESPEGQAFLKSKRNGLADTLAFFESQGVKVNRNIFTERYRSVFPTEEPEEFEHEMRERLVEMIDSAEVDPKNRAELNRFTDLVTEFLQDERNYAWVSGRFQGNNDAFGKWVVQIIRNPVPSPLEQTPETVVSESDPTFGIPTDAEGTATPPTDDAKLSSEPPASVPASEKALPTTETEILEPVTARQLEIEAEKLIPELPTEAQFAKLLGEQFNPERYQKAMSTLNRYGPEEGLRRLKSDDPEIAKRIEPMLKRKENTQ